VDERAARVAARQGAVRVPASAPALVRDVVPVPRRAELETRTEALTAACAGDPEPDACPVRVRRDAEPRVRPERLPRAGVRPVRHRCRGPDS